ncbi:hypothetical protein [Acinetobacter sp. ANC 3791]|uniref:hypothetical protein n=1 Tax=Acinetobacter sp. ANC 3791 TaxID=2529836 RepID=UPI001D17E3AE|nr:hypothetical protein [Acinetobacter sp. ANC 3791]
MQRLADHVANGAYFYASFNFDSSKKNIRDLIDKLTQRYDLDQTPRQRTYRLEKGLPICTLIIQRDVFNPNLWYLHLLFTTPISRDFNLQNGVTVAKISNARDREKIIRLQEKFKDFEWIKPTIDAEIAAIQTYFSDQEELQFVLDTPIQFKATQYMTFELIRTDHKSYKQLSQKDDKEFKDRIRSYTWSWRYSKISFEAMKKRLVDIVNKLISQKRNDAAERNRAELKAYFSMLERWAVFKANRQQTGQLLHFGQRFLKRNLKKTWQQIEIQPPHLTYLPRLETYATNLDEYIDRRKIWDEHAIEIPLNVLQSANSNHEIDCWLNAELHSRSQKNQSLKDKSDELFLDILR